MLHIALLPDLPAAIEELRTEAAGEAFRFVDKLIAEWRCGTNSFAQPGDFSSVLFGQTIWWRLVASTAIPMQIKTGSVGYGTST